MGVITIFSFFFNFEKISGQMASASSKVGPSNKLHLPNQGMGLFQFPNRDLQLSGRPIQILTNLPQSLQCQGRLGFPARGTHITSGTCATNAACRDSGMAAVTRPTLPSKPAYRHHCRAANDRPASKNKTMVRLSPSTRRNFRNSAKHLISKPGMHFRVNQHPRKI